jgi:type VI secretion system protein ImpE
MTADELLRAGRPADALVVLQSDIKKRPADPKLRIFLFQLLLVMGQWERALTQLKVISELDPAALPMGQTYREVVQCELLRREVFAGRQTPLLFGEPAEWMALLVRALQLGAQGNLEEEGRVREQAFEQAPATTGTVDGRSFGWIADADPRLGPILESILNGRYYWIPFERLSKVEIEKPADLRDIAWLPATLTFTNGGQSVAFVPTRYPGSEQASDPRLVLARSTEWSQPGAGPQRGLGQRLFATDGGEYPIMDVRLIELDAPASAASPSG